MTLRLNGSSSGYTEIDAPAVAGNNNLKLPGGNGSDGNILGTDGAGNLSWVNGRMVLATSQASTSGTFVDFTGIPSWVKKITVMFNGVSTSGTSGVLVRLGDSGGIETTGYSGSNAYITGANLCGFTADTIGFGVIGAVATVQRSGCLFIVNVSGNLWAASGTFVDVVSSNSGFTQGTKTLSAILDSVRITTVNGTDTFDAGSINILYEG